MGCTDLSVCYLPRSLSQNGISPFWDYWQRRVLGLYFSSILVFCLLGCRGCVSFTMPLSHSVLLVYDTYSFIFILTLYIVSGSVLVWSYYYLDTDPQFKVFLFSVLLFLFSMYGLVFSGHLLSIFVFWDLLGFCSLFLVFYFRTRSSLAGGLLTGLSNRVGDVFLLLVFGFLGLDCCYNSIFIGYFLLVIASTKSAQVPFSAWLPAAILAPTPVSALVHSSTLVTAGVYLLFRFQDLRGGVLL